jgi:hypothetical protein
MQSNLDLTHTQTLTHAHVKIYITEFQETVAQDVTRAVGGTRNKLRILTLEAGSIKVEMMLQADMCGDGRSALEIARNLQRQVADPSSLLKQGHHTHRALSLNVVGVIGGHMSRGELKAIAKRRWLAYLQLRVLRAVFVPWRVVARQQRVLRMRRTTSQKRMWRFRY